MTLYKTIANSGGGVRVAMTTEEEAEHLANEAAYLAAKPRNDIITSIVALESTITPRRRDEAILGIDNGWLSNIRAQITTLRGKL